MSTTTVESHTMDHPPKPYLQVFIGLAVLTLIEVGIGTLESTALVVFVLMALAVAKAALVAAVFMHVWYDKNPKQIVIAAFIVPLIGATILLLSLWADYRT
ncbi:MAG: cytochrome C oxidase subunit IV family protein [Candidatus Kariarchaeaceae archaeon]|jgi:caa(3)-type oxidase subunit IV